MFTGSQCHLYECKAHYMKIISVSQLQILCNSKVLEANENSEKIGPKHLNERDDKPNTGANDARYNMNTRYRTE